MNELIDPGSILLEFKHTKWNDWRQKFNALSPDLKLEVAKLNYETSKLERNKYFVQQNAGESVKHVSPSGDYELTITDFQTKKGSWNYTQGTVRNKQGEVLFTINRNYCAFPFLWIENHKNGHKYLVCGETYQGMCVLELDTGKRFDFIDYVACMDGFGFCQAEARFHRETSLLTVAG